MSSTIPPITTLLSQHFRPLAPYTRLIPLTRPPTLEMWIIGKTSAPFASNSPKFTKRNTYLNTKLCDLRHLTPRPTAHNPPPIRR
jgi:hypothetical protein